MNKNNLNYLALEYANKINYYKLSLIKKYLKMNMKCEKSMEDKFKVASVCPICGKHSLFIEYGEEPWDDDCVACNNCDEVFDIDGKTEILEAQRYYDFDHILFESVCEDKKTYKWQKWCENEINKSLVNS